MNIGDIISLKRPTLCLQVVNGQHIAVLMPAGAVIRILANMDRLVDCARQATKK